MNEYIKSLKNQGKLKNVFIKIGAHYNTKNKNIHIKKVDISGEVEKIYIKN